MVLHGGDQDLITAANVLSPIGLRHQVDGLSGAAQKDDFPGIGCIQEFLDGTPYALISFRGPLRERMHAAMNIGIIVPVVALNRFHHGQRLLRGRGIVQVYQGLAMHALVQNGKITANFLHIIRRRSVDFAGRFGKCAHPASPQLRAPASPAGAPEGMAESGSASTTSRSRCSRTWAEFMRSRHSFAKASKSRCRADASSNPRDRR